MHGHLVIFEVQSADRRATSPAESRDIKVIVTMPQKGITMEMKPGLVVGFEIVSQANRMLCTIDIVNNPELELHIVHVQDARGRCTLCNVFGHIFMDCDNLKPARPRCSIVPQVGDKMYKSKIKLRHVVTTYKDHIVGLILDPGASILQYAGTGIWPCDQMKNSHKLNKCACKSAACAGNINWQGDAHNDTNAFNLAFGANKEEIKQKSLRASRLLRDAESAVDKICTYIGDHTAYLKGGRRLMS